MAASDPASAAPLGLRERKNRRTKLAIVKATAELTIKDGYAAATIARIAERADLAPRTISTWFPSKDDILFEGTDEQVARGVEHLRSADGDLADRLLAWFTVEAETATHDPELAGLRADAIAHDPELRARYRQIFELLQNEITAAVARDAAVPIESMGPQLMGGAAMAFLEHLAALAGTDDSETATAQVHVGLQFLRDGMRSVQASAASQ